MAATYQYVPLNVSQNEVRLIVLAPSRSFSSQVSCRLLHRSLDSDAAFEALSYAWGDADRRRIILLDGIEFSVTENLETALRHLRYQKDERSIWIDTLCINQVDVLERNEQVSKMHEIYQTAAKVVVWLGPASPNSDDAFLFLAEAASKRLLKIDDWLPKAWTDAGRSKAWRAIYDIADRDYWRRVWIIQEIFFARSIISDFVYLFHTIMDGPERITKPFPPTTLDNLAENMDTALGMPSLMQKSLVIESIDQWRVVAESGRFPPLELLLGSHRTSLSTDSRDKVYALVGIAGQYQGPRELKIDYSLSTRTTYIETVRCLMQRRKDTQMSPLDVICCISPASFSDGSLPSWVPNWHNCSPPLETDGILDPGIFPMIFYANGNSPPEPVFEIGDGVLIVEGLKIATVDHLAEVPVPPSEQPSSGKTEPNLLVGLHHSILGLGPTTMAFDAACKLAMSDSEYMPHRHKALDVRRLEFTRTMLFNVTNPTSLNSMPTSPSEETLREFCDLIMGCGESIMRLESVWMGRAGLSNTFLLALVKENLRRCRFCVSSTGLFLMAPPSSRIGDIVCVLFGCDMPVVLREIEEGHYTLVGECYADGIMYGEAMEGLADGESRVVEFRIH